MSIIRCRQRAPNHYGGTAMSWNLAQACTYVTRCACSLQPRFWQLSRGLAVRCQPLYDVGSLGNGNAALSRRRHGHFSCGLGIAHAVITVHNDGAATGKEWITRVHVELHVLNTHLFSRRG